MFKVLQKNIFNLQTTFYNNFCSILNGHYNKFVSSKYVKNMNPKTLVDFSKEFIYHKISTNPKEAVDRQFYLINRYMIFTIALNLVRVSV